MNIFQAGPFHVFSYSESRRLCQPKSLGQPGGIVSVDTLCSYPFIDQLATPDGFPLSPDSFVQIESKKTKTVRMGGKQVIVVKANEDAGRNGIAFSSITKQEAKSY